VTASSTAPTTTVSGERVDDADRRAGMLDIETEDLSGVASLFAGTNGPAGAREDSHPRPPRSDDEYGDFDENDSDEAQRAARAALQRWKSSSSE
jgi:hypothetical protein